ncbi:MAG TPA: phage holin family protein [Solirubrobacterales bacterium]|nr:phage holin family protein [Solirubrobacterales bacterium]
MRLRIIWRALLVLGLDALVLLFLSEVLSGFVLDGARAAIGAAALIGVLNALLWPVLVRLALPLTVLTLGTGALLLNGVLVAFAIDVIPGGEIGGVVEGVVVAVAMTAITATVYGLLAIDEDDFWYRHVVRRQLRRRKQVVAGDAPGLLFLEIDGLAHDVLHRALSDGSAPNLAAWLRDGSHRLRSWETDWSSQTGACQAGLLHGDNEDMPAFRWWEKERGAAIVTNHPRDAEELERRHSDGRGLLHADGASRANILSGDAPHSMLTMSTALRRRRPIGRDYAAYFARPYAVARTLVLVCAEVVRERRAARAQVRDDVRPRIARSRSYALIRAWATVVQRDLQVAAVIGDVLAGRPVIYTTFLAYDEVAHHSGIERHDALAVLRDLDRQIARIAAACPEAPRPYRLVVLSDHGQSQGETFRDRFGETLEAVVRSACEPDSTIAVESGEDDSLAYLSAGLTEVARDDTAAARTVRFATRSRRADGAVALEDDARHDIEQTHGDGIPELSVMASGCLGLISFPREPGRVSLERIEALYPQLVPALRDHPGIGFLLARSERRGATVIGRAGTRFLDEERVEGEDPLAPFGPNAAAHVKRTDGFAHCPDLIVNSAVWPDFGEVAAFEELVGSHGGLGGTQSFPFVLHPAELEWPADEVVGAERVHRIFRGWLARLGHSAYASETASPGSSTRAST